MSGFFLMIPTRLKAGSFPRQTHIGVGIETNINVEKLLNPASSVIKLAITGIMRSHSAKRSADNSGARSSLSLTLNKILGNCSLVERRLDIGDESEP